MADMDSCQWTCGLIRDFTESVWKFWWMTSGYGQEWNESGNGMVSERRTAAIWNMYRQEYRNKSDRKVKNRFLCQG